MPSFILTILVMLVGLAMLGMGLHFADDQIKEGGVVFLIAALIMTALIFFDRD